MSSFTFATSHLGGTVNIDGRTTGLRRSFRASMSHAAAATVDFTGQALHIGAASPPHAA